MACAICLRSSPREEAFLDGCFHCFCLQCIVHWTDSQSSCPPAAGPRFVCPLCKTAYASILHDWHNHSYQRIWVKGGQRSGVGVLDDAAVTLTQLQRHRRASYFTPEALQPAAGVMAGGRHSVSTTTAQRPDVAAWIRRELVAVMLEPSVDVVAAHIGGTLRSLCRSQLQRGPGSAASAGGITRQAFLAAVEKAAKPYVFEHSARFAAQLFDFAASGQSLVAADRIADAAERKAVASAAVGGAPIADDSDRESGEISASSAGSPAVAPAAASEGPSGGASAASAEGAQADGSGAISGRKEASAEPLGSDCISFSIGSDLQDTDSDAYMPLMHASAAAARHAALEQRQPAGTDTSDTAASHGSGVALPTAAEQRQLQRPQRQDEANAEQQHATKQEWQQRQQRQPDRQPAAAFASGRRQPSPLPGPRPSELARQSQAAETQEQERLRLRALKFGTPLPSLPKPAPAPVAAPATQAAQHAANGHRRDAATQPLELAAIQEPQRRRHSRPLQPAASGAVSYSVGPANIQPLPPGGPREQRRDHSVRVAPVPRQPAVFGMGFGRTADGDVQTSTPAAVDVSSRRGAGNTADETLSGRRRRWRNGSPDRAAGTADADSGAAGDSGGERPSRRRKSKLRGGKRRRRDAGGSSRDGGGGVEAANLGAESNYQAADGKRSSSVNDVVDPLVRKRRGRGHTDPESGGSLRMLGDAYGSAALGGGGGSEFADCDLATLRRRALETHPSAD